jgi:pyruvate,water dikinase
MNLFRPGIDDNASLELLGAKAYNLATLLREGFDVPPFFVVTSEAFREVVGPVNDPREAAARIDALDLPPDLFATIDSALCQSQLADVMLAVRSSAVGEDGAGLSYAGQLESCLFVRREDIADSIRRVWKSAFAERVLAYRASRSLSDAFPGVAVIVQRMIDAEVSGVAFGVDPVTGDRDAVVISAVYGLGEGLVSGELDADTYTLRGERIESIIAAKTERVVFDRNGGRFTTFEPVEAGLRNIPALSEEQVREIAERTRELNDLFDHPQDVEWCIAGGKLYILQSRPVTTITGSGPEDRSGTKILWDNSNIIESYAGVTTPLTFSFVRDVYTEVYREFCRIMGVEEETIDRNRGIFQMLGLVRGRIYYNLLNWYRLLALLPGYSLNAAFMEQMMGVKERLEDTPKIVPSERNPYLRIASLIYHLIANLIALPGSIVRFQRHLDDTLRPLERRELGELSAEELVVTFGMLEESLLRRWRVPILNDFYTMIFFGLLKRTIEKWKLDESGTLHNDLLSGEGGIISTEPLKMLRAISNRIIEDGELTRLFLAGDDLQTLQQLANYPEVHQTVLAYIDRFGDRYIGELKLETVTPKQRPEIAIRLLAGYVQSGYVEPANESRHAEKLRADAERKARRGMRGAIRKGVFGFLLRQARQRVKNRENLRFERTRVFGIVRRIFLALGGHFHAARAIDQPRDIFYLTKDEIFSWIIGASASADLRMLIAQRKSEFRKYESERLPDRFVTYGMVYRNDIPMSGSPRVDDTGDLTGLPCCPGIVRGKIRKIIDPTTAPPLDGAILVAERTDPGWAPLFPTASGLLVERGSLLSHSAIVAREMGIPAIVGIPGLMDRLEDGEEVEMDGGRGTVRKL